MLYWVCAQELNLMVLLVTWTEENRRHHEFQLLFGIYEEPVANLIFKSSIFELVCINNLYTKIYTCKVNWNFKNVYLSFYIDQLAKVIITFT